MRAELVVGLGDSPSSKAALDSAADQARSGGCRAHRRWITAVFAMLHARSSRCRTLD